MTRPRGGAKAPAGVERPFGFSNGEALHSTREGFQGEENCFPLALARPRPGESDKSEHRIDPPLLIGKTIEDAATKPIDCPWLLFDDFAPDYTTCCYMPVEQPMIAQDTFRFASGYVREIGERFSSPKHQAEFTVRVDEIRQFAKVFDQHRRPTAVAKLECRRARS